MYHHPSAARPRVHSVYADDGCHLALTSGARLVCPVHSGVVRPRSRRRCEAGSKRLCHVCVREQVQACNFREVQRHSCAACLDLDQAITAGLGIARLANIISHGDVTRRGEIHLTLAFPPLRHGAVDLRPRPRAPYWGARRRLDGDVDDADRTNLSLRLTWKVDRQWLPFDTVERRRRHFNGAGPAPDEPACCRSG